jgi:hypothetical protein
MKLWLLVMLFALPLAAQEQKKPENPTPLEHKLFVLKYADPRKVQELLGMLGAQAASNVELHAVSVAASHEAMPGIEEAIKKLDVPSPAPQNIELTAYYVVGNDSESAGSPVPKDLDNVIVQLKNAFPFKAYHLLDTLTLRMRSGFGASENSASEPVGTYPIKTSIRIGNATVNADNSTVKVDRLHAGASVPIEIGRFQPGVGGAATNPNNIQYSYQDLGLDADVDIKENQKVVVGRLSIGKDQALFLVLTARVVN